MAGADSQTLHGSCTCSKPVRLQQRSPCAPPAPAEPLLLHDGSQQNGLTGPLGPLVLQPLLPPPVLELPPGRQSFRPQRSAWHSRAPAAMNGPAGPAVLVHQPARRPYWSRCLAAVSQRQGHLPIAGIASSPSLVSCCCCCYRRCCRRRCCYRRYRRLYFRCTSQVPTQAAAAA